jgi:hypothetical protein
LFLQPTVGPFSKIQLAVRIFRLNSSLEAINHVVEYRILVAEFLDVELARFLEDGSTNEVVHCFEPSRALSVRNFIEGGCSLASVLDLHADGVGARLEISFDCQRVVLVPHLVDAVKDFGVLSVHSLGKGDTAEEVGETLLQPEIIPPHHRRQVSEPHVGELVQVNVVMNSLDDVVELVCRHQNSISEGNSTDVLHGRDSKLRTVDDVVLVEWEGAIEQFTVVLHALSNHTEDQVRLNVGLLGVAHENTHRGDLIVTFVFDDLVLTSAQVVQVSANIGGDFEVPKHPGLIVATIIVSVKHVLESTGCKDLFALEKGLRFLGLEPVRNDSPLFLGGQNLELQGRPDARLIEAGEETVAKERFQVRKDIHFIVFRVLIVVQPRAVCYISVPEVELHRVLARLLEQTCWENDFVLFELHSLLSRIGAIDPDVRDLFALEIEVDVFLIVLQGEFGFDNAREASFLRRSKLNKQLVADFRELLVANFGLFLE